MCPPCTGRQGSNSEKQGRYGCAGQHNNAQPFNQFFPDKKTVYENQGSDGDKQVKRSHSNEKRNSLGGPAFRWPGCRETDKPRLDIMIPSN